MRWNNGISLALVLAVFLAAVLGCGGSAGGGGTPPPSQYWGTWTGQDGTVITIRQNGTADYKSGGSTVTNGALTIDENAKTLKITMVGFGPSYTIDKAPEGDKMTLSGMVFKRSGGGSTDSNSNSSSTTSKAEVPSDDKLQTLVKTTFSDISDAVRSGDFTDFHKKISKPWRDQDSPEKLKEQFNKSALDVKTAIANLDATFTAKPLVEEVSGYDQLVVEGNYPTTPKKVNFVLKYIMEDGEWKLVNLDIKFR